MSSARVADGPAHTFGPALFAVFSLLFMFTTGVSIHWLDSGEFALAASTLGVPHPPGHPGYVMTGHAMSLIPIGSHAFRSAVMSGLWGAGAVMAVYLLGIRLITCVTRRDTPTTADAITSAIFASAFGVSAALWVNAVRAEVYTMQAACILGAFVLALGWATGQARRHLYHAALLAGLGLINHHYLTVLAVPGLAVLAWFGARGSQRPGAILGGVLAMGALPLLAYSMLPLRAASEPILNFGDPDTLSRFWDTLTARQFQSSVQSAGALSGETLAAALVMHARALGVPTLLLGLVGLWAVWRRQPAVGLALLLGCAATVASKIFMALDPQNPDADGYFLVAYGIIAALSTAGAAAIHRCLAAPAGRVASAVAVMGAALVVGLNVPMAYARSELSDTRAAPALDTVMTSGLAPDALLLTGFYTLHFNRLWFADVEGFRADIRSIQMGLGASIDAGRSMHAWAQKHAPKASALTRDFVAKQSWPMQTAQELASRIPLYVEPALSAPFKGWQLNYASINQRVLGSKRQPEQALRVQAEDMKWLDETLRSELIRLPEPRKLFMILGLQLAVTHLERLDGSGAMMALTLVERISPNSPYVKRLSPIAHDIHETQRVGDQDRLRRLAATVGRTDFSQLLFGGAR